MANTIVITKLSNGNIEVLKSGVNPRTHTSTYSCRSTATGIVQVVDEATRVVIDTFNPVDVEKVVSTDGGEVFISDVATLYTQLSTYFFFKPSANGGGSVPTPPPTGDGELISIEGVTQWDTRPYTVDDGTDDARFKGDVYASGDFLAQQNSTVYANNIKLGVTGDKLAITNIYTGNQSLIAKNEISAGVSTGTKDIFRYSPFTKTDPNGQPQPDDSLTFSSTSFVEDLTGETKYFYQVTLTSTSTLVTDTWYVRCLTGLTNSYVYIYKGGINFNTLTSNQKSQFWASNTDKDIINKNNLVTNVGGAGVDITYPLGNTFFEEVGDVYTYVFVADNDFTTQGQNYGIDIPYIKGDGSSWGVVNTSSKAIFNGNESTNDFNGVLQVNNNSTEYYGCDIVLDAGIYSKIEIPYRSRNSTSDPAYLYGIILDQDDNTISYKRLYVGQNSDTEGVFTIQFDSDILIETSSVYKMVIGRRGWNSNTKRVEIFHKDVNSSSGSVWVANKNNSNSALDTDDTSGVDWSTINKQNYNRIPKTLIYKY